MQTTSVLSDDTLGEGEYNLLNNLSQNQIVVEIRTAFQDSLFLVFYSLFHNFMFQNSLFQNSMFQNFVFYNCICLCWWNKTAFYRTGYCIKCGIKLC